ncbi:hypothetical protein D3C72_1438890 [compost metagenome]
MATLATSAMCVLRRASSLAKYCSSAAWLRLRSRPNRSISHTVVPSDTPYELLMTRWPVLERPAGTRCRVPSAATPTCGNRSARWMRYCARYASMFRAATRRLRLFCRATSISRCRRGSAK